MKNIVITGASRGIGLALAKQLSVHHRVIATTRSSADLTTLSPNINLTYVEGNIDTPASIAELFKLIQSSVDHVDILINNAAHFVNKPIREISSKEIDDVFAVNVKGLILTCQILLPLMLPGSHIVNIGSMGGFQGSVKFPGLSLYSASKSAVAGFSECLAEELKNDGISVNCLALGATDTEMLRMAFPGYKAKVSAAEMATYIGDFAVEGHRWINGKTIPVSLSTP